jgi:hypothetical protein
MLDALSQSSNAYVPKHGVLKNKRLQSANTNSKVSRFSQNTKTYYPDNYYQRVGYQMSEQSANKNRVDALGQRVRDRFNEELSYTDQVKSRGIDKRGLQQMDNGKPPSNATKSQTGFSTTSKGIKPNDLASRTPSSIRCRRNTGKVNTQEGNDGFDKRE